MEVFAWPYHRIVTEYPESGFRVELGNSYTYTAPPPAPDQRKFTLKFQTMFYWEDGVGGIDRIRQPELNMACLEDFYNAHKLYKSFIYSHPVYGDLVVKFNKPLHIPEGIPGGTGAVMPFEVELLEQP